MEGVEEGWFVMCVGRYYLQSEEFAVCVRSMCTYLCHQRLPAVHHESQGLDRLARPLGEKHIDQLLSHRPAVW